MAVYTEIIDHFFFGWKYFFLLTFFSKEHWLGDLIIKSLSMLFGRKKLKQGSAYEQVPTPMKNFIVIQSQVYFLIKTFVF